MSFTLERRSHELVFRRAKLAERTEITTNYQRIRLSGDELVGFDSPGADDHIRVFFSQPGTSTPTSPEEWRTQPTREYTPVAWDGGAGILELEFLIHGNAGIAGPWARDAAIGSSVGIGGPRGSQVITGKPGGWFLAGDETAIPAIRRLLMQADAPGSVFIEISDVAQQIPLDTPPGIALSYIYRDGRPAGEALAEYLNQLSESDRPAEDTFVFIAAEQSIVRPGRALLDRWSISPTRAVVKGYWKRGIEEYHAPH